MNIIDENILSELKKNVAFQIGQQIKTIRKRKRLTQSELAFLVGMDRQYLYKIETAKVTSNIGTIATLAFAMEITLAELFQDINYTELE